MNMHGLVRGAIQAVNPDIAIDYYQSNGFTQNASFEQVPAYVAVKGITGNAQALTNKDLKHEDLVSLQGTLRAVYCYGNIQGIVRPDNKGGDLMRFPQVPGGTKQTWLVVTVLETWPDWCKVAVVLQVDKGPPA